MFRANLKTLKVLLFLAMFASSAVFLSACTPKSQKEKDLKEAQKILNKLPGGKGRKLSQEEKEKRITARKAFAIADREAKKWNKDAFLIEISNFFGSEKSDGLSDVWKLEFASPNKGNKRLTVNVSDSTASDQRESENYMQPHPVVENWIDSPEAMKIASQYWSTEKVKSYWLGLGADTWNIKCSRQGKKPLWVEINAATGELIKTREGY